MLRHAEQYVVRVSTNESLILTDKPGARGERVGSGNHLPTCSHTHHGSRVKRSLCTLGNLVDWVYGGSSNYAAEEHI